MFSNIISIILIIILFLLIIMCQVQCSAMVMKDKGKSHRAYIGVQVEWPRGIIQKAIKYKILLVISY